MHKTKIIKGILALAIALLSLTFVFGQPSEKKLAFGAGAYNSWYNMNFNTDSSVSGGFQVRWKFNPLLGVSADFISQGDMYYYLDHYESVWVGPVNWEDVPDSGYDKDEWGFSHSELVAMFNLTLSIPLGSIQPYVSVGPAFYFYSINNEFDNDEFEEYFNELWSGYDSSIGYSIKGGTDFFLKDWLSLGFAIDFIVDDMDEFIGQVKAGFPDEDYVRENSFAELNLLLWF